MRLFVVLVVVVAMVVVAVVVVNVVVMMVSLGIIMVQCIESMLASRIGCIHFDGIPRSMP